MSILHKLPSFYVTIICAASGSLPFGLGRETHHGDLRWQFDDQFALRGGNSSPSLSRCRSSVSQAQ